MKNPVLSLLTLSCAAFAVAVPDWKESLHADAPSYFVVRDAVVTQTLKVDGCKLLKTKDMVGNVVLKPDGTYEFRRSDWASAVSGTWSAVPGNKKSTYFYMMVDSDGLSNLFSELNADAEVKCGAKVTGIEPTALFKKNRIDVKAPDNSAKGTIQLNAKQDSRAKVGNMKATIKLTGTMTKVSEP